MKSNICCHIHLGHTQHLFFSKKEKVRRILAIEPPSYCERTTGFHDLRDVRVLPNDRGDVARGGSFGAHQSVLLCLSRCLFECALVVGCTCVWMFRSCLLGFSAPRFHVLVSCCSRCFAFQIDYICLILPHKYLVAFPAPPPCKSPSAST